MIPVNSPLLRGNEKKYVNECLDSGWISSEGSFISRFEAGMASYAGRQHAVAVSSGTAALEAAVKVLGIAEGDEVIVPTLTIISCVSSIVRAGAKPVLVDCDPTTFNMDPIKVKEKITSRTKAIMIVHLYGLPCDMDPLLKLGKEHGLKIIEDSAEMLGQEYRGKKCGSFGDVSIFSFYANKLITTGEGGMILTDNSEIAEECRALRNLYFNQEQRFVHEKLGWNYRMTNIQGALGLAQLEVIDQSVTKKRWIGNLYNELLSEVSGVQLPLLRTDYAENIFWAYSIVLDEKITINVSQKLFEKGIGTRPFFWCMHQQPVFKKEGLFKGEIYPHAERAAKRGFYLPCGLSITAEQIKEISKELKGILS